MILPENLTLDELINALKSENAMLLEKGDIASIHTGNLTSFLYLAETIKRELDALKTSITPNSEIPIRNKRIVCRNCKRVYTIKFLSDKSRSIWCGCGTLLYMKES